MRKHLIAMLSLSLLFSSASLFAADLEQDMDTLKDGLSVVKKTSDAQEMHAALGKMRAAAQDAKNPRRKNWKVRALTAHRSRITTPVWTH